MPSGLVIDITLGLLMDLNLGVMISLGLACGLINLLNFNQGLNVTLTALFIEEHLALFFSIFGFLDFVLITLKIFWLHILRSRETVALEFFNSFLALATLLTLGR